DMPDMPGIPMPPMPVGIRPAISGIIPGMPEGGAWPGVISPPAPGMPPDAAAGGGARARSGTGVVVRPLLLAPLSVVHVRSTVIHDRATWLTPSTRSAGSSRLGRILLVRY